MSAESKPRPLSVIQGGARDAEVRLIERACGGDMDAWSRLYQEHFPGMLRYVAYLVGDIGVAEDLVQESFAVAVAQSQRFENRAGGHSAFRGWVRGIAANLARKHWRKHARRNRAHERLAAVADIQAGADPDVERLLERDRRADALLAALDGLPSNLREAFVLSDVHGLSASEGGVALGISAGNFRVRASRARARIRQTFESAGLVEGGR